MFGLTVQATTSEESSEYDSEEDEDALALLPTPPPKPARRSGVAQLWAGGSAAPPRGSRAALSRLRVADKSGDVNQMHAALMAVGGRMPAICGVAVSTTGGPRREHKFMASLQWWVTRNATKTKTFEHASPRFIREKLHRLWELMVIESACLAEEAGSRRQEVSRRRHTEGYRRCTFITAKVLIKPSRWSDASSCMADRAGQMTSRASAARLTLLCGWTRSAKSSVRQAARAVSSHCFTALFAAVDT